jgi:hypothetical protein
VGALFKFCTKQDWGAENEIMLRGFSSEKMLADPNVSYTSPATNLKENMIRITNLPQRKRKGTPKMPPAILLCPGYFTPG